MTSFADKFGGSPVQSTDISYLAYTFDANAVMSWPKDSEANPVARIMDLVTSAGITIQFPPANEVSPGRDVLLRNLGASDFTVLDNANNVIATVRVGQIVLLYIVDNSTVAGAWRSVLFGVGSSILDAASLQGLGVLAIGNTLAQGHPVVTVSANTNILPNNRASVLVWKGGSGILSLPFTSAVDDTFFFEIRNQGSGNVSLAARVSETIDGVSSISLQPGDSAFIHASPLSWYSVGRGRSAQFNFTQLVKTVTGGTTVLSATEAANVVQKYIGALATDQIVVFPAVVQVYFVSNATTGAHTLTFQSPTPGSTVTVPSNQNAILFCDGTNVINTSTTIAGFASLILSQGSQSTPPLTFTGNLTTGVYQPLTNTVGITCNGVEVTRFTPTDVSFTGAVTVGGNLSTAGTFSAAGAVTAPSATFAGNVTFGNGALTVTGQAVLGTLNATTPLILFDTTDFLAYDRTANRYSLNVGNTAMMTVDAASVAINGPAALNGIVGVRSDTGSGGGGRFSLTNTSVGATNPSKFFDIGPTGNLRILNNAFSAALLNLDDTGNVNVAGNIAVQGPAFAASFNVSSAAALKNVEGDLLGEDAFRRVMLWMPKLYTLKAEEKARVRAGLIVEEAPVEITDGEGHIDIYAAMTEMGAALQYVARKVGLA